MIPIKIKNNDKILIIAPHPDDECIGVGGILVNYTSQCDVWLLTDGCKGMTDSNNRKLGAIRKKEFENEMKYLKISSYKMFGLKDGTLSQYKDMLDKENLSCYTKIFVTNKNDIHKDHRAAYEIVVHAIRVQALFSIELFQYEVSEPLMIGTHFYDFTKEVKKKEYLISFHKSQLETCQYTKMMTSLASYRAYSLGFIDSYIETYVLSDLHKEKIDIEQTKFAIREQKKIQQIETYDKWVKLLLEGKSISNYLINQKYYNVAIYGFASLGRRLFQELKKNNRINVKYIIDKMAKQKRCDDLNIVDESQGLLEVDIIIVTALYDYDDIKQEFVAQGNNNVFSIYELLELID